MEGEKKPLEILVVEDLPEYTVEEYEKKTGKKLDNFEDYLRESLAREGYNANIKWVRSYEEYKKIKDSLNPDVVVSDIMMPAPTLRKEIEELFFKTIRDDTLKEKYLEIIEKYNEKAIGDYEKEMIHEAVIGNDKELVDYYSSFLIHGRTGIEKGDYPAGIWIAKDFKDKGKKITLYTEFAGSRGHSLRGIVLNALLGEVVPIEDWNSVAESEHEDKSGKLHIPKSGRITIVSSGYKVQRYPEAIIAAIKYQTK